MTTRRWFQLFLTAWVLALGACGGGSSSDSHSLKGTTYSGSLSGGKSGTFSFTVNDDSGNGTGSATFSSRTYALSGGVSSNGSFVMDMPGAGGRISGSAGSAGSSGLTGNWYADLPVSTSSATTQAYSGTASASTGSSSAGTSGGSTSGGSAASCGFSNYKGPTDDPQTYTICAEAYSYKCLGDTTNAAKTCSYLTSVLKAYSSSQTAASYCSAYCS